MIPAIGYMVAFYIITRMLMILIPKKADGSESVITVVFAAITIIVALLGIYVLFSGELDTLSMRDFMG